MRKPDSLEPADSPAAQNGGGSDSVFVQLSSLWSTWKFSVLAALAMVFIPLALYIGADLNGCFEFKYPPSVLDHKTFVVDGSNEFDVTIKLEGWNAGSVYNCASEMAGIVKHEVKIGNQNQNIVFHVVGDVHTGGGYDSYGKAKPVFTTTFNAFNIRYSMDDMKRVNWDDMSGIALLNLGSVSRFGSAGDDVARRYCELSIAQTYSQDFCANF